MQFFQNDACKISHHFKAKLERQCEYPALQLKKYSVKMHLAKNENTTKEMI